MTSRTTLLLAIEKNELRVWTFTRRVLERWRQPARGELDGAIRWADDALRARREEIAYCRAWRGRGARGRPPASHEGQPPSPREEP